MTKIGLYIAFFGVGSMILNSFGYEFKILMWMGEGYGIRIGIIALGLILAFIGYKYVDKKEETPAVAEPKVNTSNTSNTSNTETSTEETESAEKE